MWGTNAFTESNTCLHLASTAFGNTENIFSSINFNVSNRMTHMAAVGQHSLWSTLHKDHVPPAGTLGQHAHHLPVSRELQCGHLSPSNSHDVPLCTVVCSRFSLRTTAQDSRKHQMPGLLASMLIIFLSWENSSVDTWHQTKLDGHCAQCNFSATVWIDDIQQWDAVYFENTSGAMQGGTGCTKPISVAEIIIFWSEETCSMANCHSAAVRRYVWQQQSAPAALSPCK